MYRRNRVWLTICLVAVILAGLASRRFPSLSPAFVGSYPGDALWSLAVFIGYALVAPTASSGRLALLALATSYAVEASQLYQQPWINSIRGTTAGHLVLGAGFDPLDLIAYTAGVAFAFVVDRGFARHHRPT